MASLRDLQRSFAAALRNPNAHCAVRPPANLGVYRNNSSAAFRGALERTYPVVRRRVGDEYFRQLCALCRERFPSRSGDLHWAGRDFGTFLENHLAGSGYAWLADLARLEWSRAECLVASESTALGVDALASVPAESLEHVIFELQPSLKLHASPFPVFTVWSLNQVDNAPSVDQSLGSERGMVRARHEGAEVRKLDAPLYSYISALARGATLTDAMTSANLDAAALRDALHFVFSESLVISLRVSG